ncbi:Anoctamin-8, partial [Corvus brachyrhynchos]
DPPEEDYSTQLTQAEVESCMKKYEDTFQDYQEMFIQFGYVVLFSSAFPLAAMCALVNNVIEIRSDAFKLCTGLQRPFGQRVQSIGQWQKVMEAMGVLAIVVNCYLIAQCGQLQRLFPGLSPEGAIVSVVVLEVPERGLRVGSALWGGHRVPPALRPAPEVRHPGGHSRHSRLGGRGDGQAGVPAPRGLQGGSCPGGIPRVPPGCPQGPGGSPKCPRSLLATNNVMKLKQIIPLQGKFLSGGTAAGGTATARSPQSPTGSENKLPGFLSFKFLKSPETKRDAGTEKVQSPTKPFNPGKLFNFG